MPEVMHGVFVGANTASLRLVRGEMTWLKLLCAIVSALLV